jgi:hypothetical protein
MIALGQNHQFDRYRSCRTSDLLFPLDIALDRVLPPATHFLALYRLHLARLFQVFTRLGHVEHPGFYFGASGLHHVGDTE